MSFIYKKIVRLALFARNAESAHEFTLNQLANISRDKFLCSAVGKIFSAPDLPVELFGLKFPNPVGLAAGMDKFAAAVPVWEKLGFGFCELGGVTWHAQPGNPSPRMFRAIADEAIVNRMGFNNDGAEALARKLREWKKFSWPKHPVGINLGKSKITPLEDAAEDYAKSFCALRELADFFVVNVSSPNTPGLRQLQDKNALDEILVAIQEVQSPKSKVQTSEQSAIANRQSPILIKIAPDLSLEAIDEILELAKARNVSGIVATNTTISRPQTDDAQLQKIYSETGGLSGRPLRYRSTEIIRHIYKQTRGQLPIIGVGGIFNADDAWEKISAGASLVQIYTGLVYEGPALTKQIVIGLREKLEQAGLKSLGEAVGSAL